MPQIFDELDSDWRHLCSDNKAGAGLGAVFDVAGVSSLEGLVSVVRGAAPAEADRILRPLARLAADGDGLAVRVLLQLLLPGTRRLARTWWALGDRDERASAAVSAVWERIRCYPVERRPTRVAANILMDAAADLRRSLRDGERVFLAGFSPVGEPTSVSGLHPAVELAEVLVDAVAAHVISRGDADLIASSRIAGVPLPELAKRRGMPVRTAQWRRKRAEAALVAASPSVA
jgi:hypothetical protein